MVKSKRFVTTPLFQGLPFNYQDFTPIALLALDNFPLWVGKDTPWHTWEEFLATAKERSIQVAGTGTKQEDEIVWRLILRRRPGASRLPTCLTGAAVLLPRRWLVGTRRQP